MASTSTSFKKGGVTTKITITEKDFGMDAIVKEIKKINGSYTKVGFPSGSTTASNMDKAFYNEVGSEANNTPARPFMKQTFDDSTTQSQLSKLITASVNTIYEGKSTVKKTLSRMGEWYGSRIKNEIMTGSFEPNAVSTIKAKGSSKPLIDSSQMKNAITHVEIIK